MVIGSLFSGAGLLDAGLAQAGHEHAWFVESDQWRREHLARRWSDAAVRDDVRTAGRDNLCPVDCIAGGWPCKGNSTAGRRTGLAHPETALWADFARIVGELCPAFVAVENVANVLAIHDGAVWRTVLWDLAALGYDVAWTCVRASDFGAPHQRDRVIAIASHPSRHGEGGSGADVAPERVSAKWCDCGHRLFEHRRVNISQGDNPVYRYWCQRCSCIDFEATTDASLVGHERGRRAWSGRDGLADGGQAAADAARNGEGGPNEAAGADGERARTGADEVAECGCAWDYIDAGGFCACCQAHLDDPRGLYAMQGDGSHGFRDCPGQAAADADERGCEASAQLDGGAEQAAADGHPRRRHADGRDGQVGRGVAVEWGDYEPAIRRWEAVHGPAPEPLVRRLDDGDAKLRRVRARVDRSRLSALGDGVHVYLGRLIGDALHELERGGA